MTGEWDLGCEGHSLCTLSSDPFTHQRSSLSSPRGWVGRGTCWGRVVEGPRAERLWAELGKDSLFRGRTTHLGAVWESGIRLLQQNSKDQEGECGHPRGNCPPLHGPVSGQCQGWADRQETWVLVSTLLSICCVTLGKTLPLSEHQSVQ